MRRNDERGAILGVVLVLLIVLLLAGGLAVWGLRSETGSAGSDRLARQLFDCAEEGLAWGKQYFSGPGADWNGTGAGSYLAANDVCSYLPCPPFGKGDGTACTFAPAVAATGGRYPDQPPFTVPVQFGTQTFIYTVGIFDNQDEDASLGNNQNYCADLDGVAIVYSRCVDPNTRQARSVQAIIRVQVPSNADYKGQAGGGYRNQGNAN